MSFLGRIVTLFPLIHGGASLYFLVRFVQKPNLTLAALALGAVYLFPLLVFRLHSLWFPLKEGRYDLLRPEYCPWWGSYNIQLLFNAFPYIERVLILVPGLYSLWLRAWGSKIGRRVFYAATIELLDRSLLELGDDIVVGSHTIFCAHGISPHRARQMLLVKKIRVGSRSFIGAESRLGPGANLQEDTLLPYGSKASAFSIARKSPPSPTSVVENQ